MNLPIEGLKYFGLYSIIFCTVIPVFLMRKWKADKATTLSRHVAQNRQTYLIFAIGSVVWQSLFLAYIIGWFIPQYHLGNYLGAVVIIGTICQLLSAWIPDTNGLSSKIHLSLAWAMGITMFTFTAWVSVSPTIGDFAKIFSLIALLLMAVLLVSPIFIKKTLSLTLVGQSLYIGLFYLTVLFSGYIS